VELFLLAAATEIIQWPKTAAQLAYQK